jgi:dUTP pyrophosphatase
MASTSIPAPLENKVDQLQIKRLSEKARLPTRGSASAAGYDLYASKDTVVPARGKVLVDTDLAMAVPEGTCAFAPLLCPFHHVISAIGAKELD